jgi:hypothetical protein
MIITLALDPAISPASWDAVVDVVHSSTPLLLVRDHGILHAGTDNIDEIRTNVRRWSARAAMAPDRTSSMLCAFEAVPGRLDAHASAEHVSINVLRDVPELQIDEIVLERLRLFGLSSIGTLRGLSERHLRAQFGDLGVRLYRLLHTTSTTLPLFQPPDEIQVRVAFVDATCEPGPIYEARQQACTEIITQLSGREAWRVDVGVLDRSGEISARRGRIMRVAIATLRHLETHVDALIRQLLTSARRWWGLRIRLTSLRLPIGEQIALFDQSNSLQDLRVSLVPKYGSVIKEIRIHNPWSIIPEDYARIIGQQQ